MLAIHNKIQENAQILMQNIFINPFLEILLSANIKMRTSLYIKHVKDNIRLHPMLLHWQSVHAHIATWSTKTQIYHQFKHKHINEYSRNGASNMASFSWLYAWIAGGIDEYRSFKVQALDTLNLPLLSASDVKFLWE